MKYAQYSSEINYKNKPFSNHSTNLLPSAAAESPRHGHGLWFSATDRMLNSVSPLVRLQKRGVYAYTEEKQCRHNCNWNKIPLTLRHFFFTNV